MAVSNQTMTLAPQQLSDFDAALLDLLYEGRVTPALAQTLLAERSIAEVSQQYINQRISWLRGVAVTTTGKLCKTPPTRTFRRW